MNTLSLFVLISLLTTRLESVLITFIVFVVGIQYLVVVLYVTPLFVVREKISNIIFVQHVRPPTLFALIWHNPPTLFVV